ncbi:Hydroquinone glucosyltransferase [Sesamum angolense]|uniref:Hydroquinone glucosyltransferase n=1 Tax=Sesamum angolense TaxID=2727404 RepID=A0AAE1X2H0_9LAMI|nr:Hydroquinone glucosyltransferase [Sesamum angolense]
MQWSRGSQSRSFMKPQKSLFRAFPPQLTPSFSHSFTDDLPLNASAELLLSIRLTRSFPALRDTLTSFKELGTSAAALLDESCTSEYRDMVDPITLPGSILSRIGIRSSQGFRTDVFRVFPRLPCRRRTERKAESDAGSECVKWLNDQPPKSVLFVSFGSGGTLSVEQFKELALGLEMCGQRFLWVVRTPQESAADAYLNTQSFVKDPLDYLPEGFLERTKGRGLVVVSWAPQIQVLSHRMNAVFLTDGLKGAIRVKPNENGIVWESKSQNWCSATDGRGARESDPEEDD